MGMGVLAAGPKCRATNTCACVSSCPLAGCPLHAVPCLLQVAALEDKVAGQRGLAAEQGQRLKDMEVCRRVRWEVQWLRQSAEAEAEG